MSLDEVRRAIGAVPGVQSAHDLHVWSITSGKVSCSVNVVVDDIAKAEATRNRVAQMLAQALQIQHAIIQTERQECAEMRPTHTRPPMYFAQVYSSDPQNTTTRQTNVHPQQT